MLLAKWLQWRRNPVLVPLALCVIGLQLVIIIRMDSERTVYIRERDNEQETSSSEIGRTDRFSVENGTNSVYSWQNCACGLHFRINTEDTAVFPVQAPVSKKFLAIGIPTVKRAKGDYLTQTVTSLLSNMDDVQRNEVVIVILVADLDPGQQNATSHELYKNFKDAIQNGILHVIRSPDDLYSSYKVTKQTWGQSMKHVTWRSKQNVDYAYLMKYSAPLSQYYMQLEDDVITSKDYISVIRKYIQQQNTSWACLEFSELGFIGKLFKSEDVPRLAQVLLMFYQEQPGDYAYQYFNMLMAQYQKRLRTPTLFQHEGTLSSLPGKVQPLKDRFFAQVVKKYKGDNPPAEIYTTLKDYLTFHAKLAYLQGDGFFWSNGSPDVGDSYMIVFDEPQDIDRIIVETGADGTQQDILKHGKLVASLTLLKNSNRLSCANDIDLGEFKDGRIEVEDVGSKVKFKVMCLQIQVVQKQEQWVILREIAVFLKPS